MTHQLCKSQEQWIGDNMEILNEWITIAMEEDKILALEVIWFIWLAQNESIFQNKPPNLYKLKEIINLLRQGFLALSYL
jgi:hypothetical protein